MTLGNPFVRGHDADSRSKVLNGFPIYHQPRTEVQTMTTRDLIAAQIRCMVDAIGLEEVFNVLVEVQSDRKALAESPVVTRAATPPPPPPEPTNGHVNGNRNGNGTRNVKRRGMLQRMLAYFDSYPLDNTLSKDHVYRWMRNEFGTSNVWGSFGYAVEQKYIVEVKKDTYKLTAAGRKRARDKRIVARVN